MFELLAERAPQVEGDDELARYVQALLVAMGEEDDEALAWMLLMGPPSWMREPKGADLSSRNVKVDMGDELREETRRIERVMRKPPKFRIPGPAQPPPLAPPDWQE